MNIRHPIESYALHPSHPFVEPEVIRDVRSTTINNAGCSAIRMAFDLTSVSACRIRALNTQVIKVSGKSHSDHHQFNVCGRSTRSCLSRRARFDVFALVLSHSGRTKIISTNNQLPSVYVLRVYGEKLSSCSLIGLIE
jgi:hypothetical protein